MVNKKKFFDEAKGIIIIVQFFFGLKGKKLGEILAFFWIFRI